MKKAVFLATLGLASACTAQAQETGRVISSTPVIVQVAVPRQFCSPQPMAVAPATSGAGSVIGAVAGGILGNTVGHGMGRAAATALGAVGGALVGNHVEAGNSGYATQLAQHCRTETTYENRTVGYNVTYEWGGRNYTVQMPYDPGSTVALQVAPVGASSVAASPDINQGTLNQGTGAPSSGGIPILRSYDGVTAPAGTADGPHYPLGSAQAPHSAYSAYPAYAGQPGYPVPSTYPAPVVYPAPAVYPAPLYYGYGAPAYPMYGTRPYYAPIGISLNLGYSRGFGHRHGHRHGGHHRWR